MEQEPGGKKPIKPARVAKPTVAKGAASPAAPAVAKPVVARPAAAPIATAVAAPAAVRANQSMAAKQASANGSAEGEEEEGEEPQVSWISGFLRDSPSWLTSLIVHMVILLVLALWMLPAQIKEVVGLLTSNPSPVETPEEIEEITEEVEQLENVETTTDVTPQPVTENIQPEANFSPAEDLESAAVAVELSDMGDITAPKNDLMAQIGSTTGTGMSGRGKAARSALVAQGGGTPGSEEAVAKALKWLAQHQNPDGSWCFDHRIGPCQGRCPNQGTMPTTSRIGATAMALLPFLGAGQTHKEGTYQKTVGGGLYFLVKSMKVSPKGGDLMEPGGSMYSHGLASIALCEAYGMTQDRGLMAPAQAAINFICYAQDPVGGGWRYAPHQAGDTSAVGWQIMALKSAHMSYLQVPPITVKKASEFLDSVQVDSGSGYGYTGPANGSGTSAVGLLARMYLGWKRENAALERGCLRFANAGPAKGAWYTNYYANQVLFQFSNGGKGEVWKKWNEKMREDLIASQSKQGHTEGSWHIPGDHGSDRGGRLYCTALATLMLEVYYRHMPIFKDHAVEEDFPL